MASLARDFATSLAEQRIEEEAERARVEALLSAVPDAVLVVDGEGCIDYANERVEPVFGWAAGDLVGRSIECLVPEAAREAHVGLRRGFAREAGSRPMGKGLDIRGQRRDGTTFHADVKLAPVTVAGELVFVTSVRDVTESRETTLRLAELSENLEAANVEMAARNVELEQFTFAASHDLQEPLRKIVAFGDRIERRSGDALDERGRDYLARMQSAARRMQALIADLLRWSRLTTRANPPAPVSLDGVLRDVVDDLEIAVERSGAEVDVGPLATVDADEPQMHQLFQNLVGNAIKYRDEARPPRVEVRGERDGDFFVVRVSDNGIGFDPKYADRIFDVFERLHGRGDYEGTGIGLALCRKIVRRHGGSIDVESEPGVGTTFTVRLPDSEPTSRGEQRMSTRRSVTILYADDDPDDQLLVQEALEESRLLNELRLVSDGEELMDYLKRRGDYADPGSAPRPGLILLDLNMPRKDGREALAEIKADPELRKIPVVVLTTSQAEEDILRSYDLGVNSFVTKPVTFESMVDKLKALGRYWFEIVELPE